MLQGTKVVLALPHGMGTSLGQETLLDVPSEGESPAPRLPKLTTRCCHSEGPSTAMTITYIKFGDRAGKTL